MLFTSTNIGKLIASEAVNKYDLIYYYTFNEFIHPIQPFSNT